MKRITIGILAHVDAGKTTLSEGLLYRSGAIRTLGRVDHRDAHLDTDALERARGITIFSKQARLRSGETEIVLLDTPGHIDFSCEMERTLQVLDYAVLVISGTDGVQAHTETLWQLLARYHVPTFLFVTKLDLPNAGRNVLLAELHRRLSPDCADALAPDFPEEAAMQDETLLSKYMETERLSDADIAGLVHARRLFPCYFGAALKLKGVDALLEALDRYTVMPDYGTEFGAKVYKILYDAQGVRMTCLKVTGGTLHVRDTLAVPAGDGETIEEKVTQLRLYNGAKFEAAQEVSAGGVCMALGLSATRAGQGLGVQQAAAAPVLQPVMIYDLLLPSDCDRRALLPKLQQLAEEDPLLRIAWDAEAQQIRIQLMGEVQIEVLRSMLRTRFDVEAEISEGKILYLETIAAPVEGVGHFEPLRHYAEVHLLLEPLPRGSGLEFGSTCSENILDRNWQRLILTHLLEKQHRGVLTGAPITDMRITLAAGRAHPKHTEGGDFRQATYRAVRQGLMQADSILLEPVYRFRIEVPQAQIGRVIQDLRTRHGEFSAPEHDGELAVLTGTAPVATLRGYAAEVRAFTHGLGRFSCRVSGYAPCHNADAVLAARAYDPEADLENTPDSVFCKHGGGFLVKWNEVPQYMHLESCLKKPAAPDTPPKLRTANLHIDEKELEAILLREFGPISRRQYTRPVQHAPEKQKKLEAPRRRVLIVDGYNVIFAWDGLKELTEVDLDGARIHLMDMLSNYAGFTGVELILVFDAYKVRDGRGSRSEYHNIHIVYTKENETCDLYIERLSHEIGKNDAVRVVTSDSLIQLSALRAGVLRVSAREFRKELDAVSKKIADAAAGGTP